MRCSKARRTDAAGEGEELAEAEAPVAADARIRRLTGLVPGDERRDHRRAEALAEVERHVWNPERVAGLARREDRGRGAARALAVRPDGVGPEAKRDPDHLAAAGTRLQERDSAVHPAAHRDGNPGGMGSSADGRREGHGEGAGNAAMN